MTNVSGGRQPAQNILMEETRDQRLVRDPLLRCLALDLTHIRFRDADIDPLALAQGAAGDLRVAAQLTPRRPDDLPPALLDGVRDLLFLFAEGKPRHSGITSSAEETVGLTEFEFPPAPSRG